MGSLESDRRLATERRERIVNFLVNALTDPDSPLDLTDLAHFRLIGGWFGGTEMLDRIIDINREKPQLCQEVLLSVIVAALDRFLT